MTSCLTGTVTTPRWADVLPPEDGYVPGGRREVEDPLPDVDPSLGRWLGPAQAVQEP